MIYSIPVHTLRDGITRREVEARWEQDGLAINADPRSQGWNISHVESGYAVVQHMADLNEAIQLALSLLTLGDWTRPRELLKDDTKMRDNTRALLKALQK